MLGEKLREIRKSKNLTLNDVATKVGLSVGFLSQVERNNMNPTMDTLRKIADALEVSPYMLMENDTPKHLFIKKSKRIIMKFPNSKIYYEIVSPMPSKDFTPASLVTQFEIEPHGCDSDEYLSHQSEEIIVMLEGEIDVITKFGVSHLCPGDSLLLPKNSLHRTENNTDEPVKGLCILSPMKYPF